MGCSRDREQSDGQLGRIFPEPLTGDEPFHQGLDPTRITVGDFWRWSCSDLLSNATRGILAEFIVARALGAEAEVRNEWDPFDLTLSDGTTVEVKSGAYVQSWHQDKPSRITFGIAPTRAWDPATNKFDAEVKRQAEVYVFCVLGREDQREVDPLDLDQWRFFVLATKVLDHAVPDGKTIGLAGLLKLAPEEASFEGLAAAVTCARQSITGNQGAR